MKRQIPVHKISIVLLFLMLSTPLLCFGGNQEPAMDLSVKAAVEDGQIVRGHYNLLDPSNRYMTQPVPYRLWLHRGYINVRLASTVGEKLSIVAEPEVRIWFNTYPSVMITGQHTVTPFRQYSYVGIAEGQGTYSFWGTSDPRLRLTLGIFPVKYNQDALNLGEYLFRTGVYVPYIVNKFCFPYGTLSGARLSSELFGYLSQQLLIHTETQIQPLHDWSLSYLIGTTAGPFDAGAGISLHHWFITDGSLAESRDAANLYFTENGDSAFFSFKGMKLMARFAFDPKRFMPQALASKFGDRELRVFVEGAALGLHNYPAYRLDTIDPTAGNIITQWVPDSTQNYYTDLMERIPVMFGFNFPTCKLLDDLSLAFEYYPWPYKNVYYCEQGKKMYPLPPQDQDTSKYTSDDYSYDSWKWSLNIRKTLARGFSLVGQVARDHARHEFWQESQRDDEEIFTRSREWYWMMRLQYDF
ncbi:MAG: hypothetical protein JW768_04705 [Chitinispirillaceae bacterium]|nr:hypothetical protein [Chitinispirillaceae bacterium]